MGESQTCGEAMECPTTTTSTPTDTVVGAGWFVAMAGTDASGKTTAARRLVGLLASDGIDALLLELRHPPAPDPPHELILSEMAALIWNERLDSAAQLALGHRYYFLMQSAYLEALDRLVISPALRAGRVVVADSWCDKFLARALLRSGEIPTCLLGSMRSIRTPNVTFFLDIDPAVAFARRKTFTAAEIGQHDVAADANGSARAQFVAYQAKLSLALQSMRTDRWTAVDAAALTSDQVAKSIHHKSRLHLGLPARLG